MKYELSGDSLSISVESLGAELQRIWGKDGTEYLCPEALRNWDSHAPVLFPNTGWVKAGYAIVKDGRYPYVQHGFAKKSEFVLAEQTENSLRFRLIWNPETFRIFPFQFVLDISYIIEGDTLKVVTVIWNQDQSEMPCSLGFHPGFSCPIGAGEAASDYVLHFLETITADRLILQDAMVAGRIEKFWDDVTEVPVQEGMFDGGSFTMVDLSTKTVELISRVSGRKIRLDLGDYPNLVIWAPKNQKITNICMEPWYGVPDALDGNHRPEEKPCTMRIPAGCRRELCFQMKFC